MKFLEIIGESVLVGDDFGDDFVDTLMNDIRSLLREKDNSTVKTIDELKKENEILKKKMEVSK